MTVLATNCIRHCLGLGLVLMFSAGPALAAGARPAAVDVRFEPEDASPYRARTFAFAIPPQSLETALDAFTATTGVQVIYNSHLANGISSPGVFGKIPAAEALNALLARSDLLPATIMDQVVTLVSRMPVPGVENRVAHLPMLQLHRLHVEAPQTAMNHYLYDTVVEYAVRNALEHTEKLSKRGYDTEINIWLSASGKVQRSQLLASTGDSQVDKLITDALRTVTIEQAPPYDLPQPLHVRLTLHGPRQTT